MRATAVSSQQGQSAAAVSKGISSGISHLLQVDNVRVIGHAAQHRDFVLHGMGGLVVIHVDGFNSEYFGVAYSLYFGDNGRVTRLGELRLDMDILLEHVGF